MIGDFSQARVGVRGKAGSRVATALLLGLVVLAGSARSNEEGPLEAVTEYGPVTATVRLEPRAPVIGDAMILEIEAVADPDVEVLMPDFGEALERFAITNFVPREAIDDQGRTVLTQRYTLQVSRSGEHALPSILIEFVDRRPGRDPAPEGMDAFELLTDPLVFSVESVVVDAASADLSPPMDELSALGRGLGDFWVLALASTLIALAVAPFAWRAWQRSRARALRRSAYEIARAQLDALIAAPLPTPEKMDTFFVQLSAVVRAYLENRFELRSPELTTEEFISLLSDSPDLTRTHQALLGSFLEQADLVKFAHFIPSSEAIREALNSAGRFLDETREDAPLVVTDVSPSHLDRSHTPPAGPQPGAAA